MVLNSLSGRFLIVTTLFVLLAEVLILVPSIARYRVDYLHLRLERAQIAALSVLASDDVLDESLEKELLATAGVMNVVLRRDEVRQLVLSSPITQPIYGTYDLREAGPFQLIRDSLSVLLERDNRIIRVIGNPVHDAGLLIEVTTETEPLRAAMVDYGLRILLLSAVFSVVTAVLLFAAVSRLVLRPIRHLIQHVTAYAEAPEDARLIIEPSSRGVREIREAEVALRSMQTQLTQALRQKDRLAQLGGAVARISHDLRNILTAAQLFADRMESSEDPAVQRAAPKLVGSLSRAINLCESTLAFGRAEEPPPSLTRFPLIRTVSEILESETMADEAAGGQITFLNDVPPTLWLRADPEQLHRVLSNLIRNARQAIEATGQPGVIEVSAGEDEAEWFIRVGDTGPGLPQKAREFLFTPFQGGARKGGFGLGLAISAELVRGHGGRLELARSDEEGTEFIIRLPRGSVQAETAAQ
ncbi:ATPase [Haematobacter missouriensis]|uniref:histidine kinase n=1 Tax=Haematobacter missouriensis TaxID=366616 RepID=A0A212AKU3_9RHOB|nr:HAMP domain-containing sensor histidine kinase [Haematobacter missouriensis]KFI29462.1 ATPase [Haematobacter missouriensis]OWJ80055.1 sensor histidine kinase [Haematobacter missouriensis]OWJ82092.1 sensor histidine kinase [Haematobacter missouriensis]